MLLVVRPPHLSAHFVAHSPDELNDPVVVQAETLGLVMRHQQYFPLVPVLKLYSGCVVLEAADVELHVDVPDTVPYPLGKVTFQEPVATLLV